MITTRHALCLCALLFVSAPVLASTEKAWNFKVLLDGKVIGQHRFEVFDRDTTRYVAIDASFDVNVLFFNAYRYRHQNYEVWRNDCLQSIHSTTNDNGDKEFVKGQEQDGVLNLNTNAGSSSLQGCVRTFAYWDPAILHSDALLNAQTGELMPVQVHELGIDRIQVREHLVRARHYRLITDSFSIDVWYSMQKKWLALQSTTSNGAVLRYQLQ